MEKTVWNNIVKSLKVAVISLLFVPVWSVKGGSVVSTLGICGYREADFLLFGFGLTFIELFLEVIWVDILEHIIGQESSLMGVLLLQVNSLGKLHEEQEIFKHFLLNYINVLA